MINISKISIIVRNYDEAIDFYTKKLGFELIKNTRINENKRWVEVKPNIESKTSIVFIKAKNKNQLKLIGKQSENSVLLFLETNDFWSDYKRISNNGITFTSLPKEKEHGIVAVFKDLYGNKFDLIG